MEKSISIYSPFFKFLLIILFSTVFLCSCVTRNQGMRSTIPNPKNYQQKQSPATKYLMQGITRMNKRQIDEAIPYYNKAIELEPELTSAYFFRGVAYEKTGQIEKANSDYNKAKELDPGIATALANQMDAYEEGRIDDAVNPEKVYSIVEVDIPPRVIQPFPPKYPVEARNQRIDGYVLVDGMVPPTLHASEAKPRHGNFSRSGFLKVSGPSSKKLGPGRLRGRRSGYAKA